MAICTLNSTNSPVKDLTSSDIILISFSLTTAFSYVVGIVVLIKLKRSGNQTLIIMNLAVIELIQCLNFASEWVVTEIPHMSLKVFFDLAIRMFMLMLLADRFLEILLNIRYPLIIPREKVLKCLCLIWIFGGLYGLGQGLFSTFSGAIGRSWYIHNYIVIVVDIIFTISSIITYTYFCFKIEAGRLNILRRDGMRGRRSRRFNYKIPFMIIGTFLLFNVTSDILYQVHMYKKKNAFGGICLSCPLLLGLASHIQMCGYLSDAIVYIAMQQNVRKFIRILIMPRENRRTTSAVALSYFSSTLQTRYLP